MNEEYDLDLGKTECWCGCGLEAGEVFNGIFVHQVNPATHYKKYKERIRAVLEMRAGARERMAERTRNQMNLGSLAS